MRLYRWMVDGEGRGFVQVEDDERLFIDVIGPFGHSGGWYEAAQRILSIELRAKAEEMEKEAPRRAPGYLAALFAIEVLLPSAPGFEMTEKEVAEWIQKKLSGMTRIRAQMGGVLGG